MPPPYPSKISWPLFLNALPFLHSHWVHCIMVYKSLLCGELSREPYKALNSRRKLPVILKMLTKNNNTIRYDLNLNLTSHDLTWPHMTWHKITLPDPFLLQVMLYLNVSKWRWSCQLSHNINKICVKVALQLNTNQANVRKTPFF